MLTHLLKHDMKQTPEEIEKAEKKAAQKLAAQNKAENELGEDEADQMESDDDEDEKKEKTEEEEYYEDEFDWDLADGEREITESPWIEGLVRVAYYKFRKMPDKVDRLEKLIEEFLIPNACKSNTDTFRGELSLDEVQAIYKKRKPQIMKIFRFYARVHEPIPGAPPQEPSMDGPAYMKFCKDSRLVTRKGDLRHDFPELECRKVFNDTQMEEEEEGSIDAGGGGRRDDLHGIFGGPWGYCELQVSESVYSLASQAGRHAYADHVCGAGEVRPEGGEEEEEIEIESEEVGLVG